MPRGLVLTFCLMTGVLSSGYGVMFTVLDEFRADYGIGETWLGVIVGVGFFASFVAQVLLAPISDRGHARTMVMIGLGLNVVGLLGMAFGERLDVLLAARLVMGIGLGIASPAIRRIVINADPANLGHNVGLLLAADVAGFAAGPAVASAMAPWWGVSSPFLAIAALTLASVPIVLSVRVNEATEAPADRFAFDLLRDRGMLSGIAMGAALFLMLGTFDALWAIVFDDLGASDTLANIGITVFALPLILLGSYGGRLAQRVGPFRLGPFGLALGAVYMALYGVMPTGLWMFAIAVVHSVSDGLTVSSASVAVGMVTPPHRQAGAQGMLGAAEMLVAGVMAVAAGAVYDAAGREAAYGVCGALMLVLVVAAWLLAGPSRRALRGDADAAALGAPVVIDPAVDVATRT